ncbi:hypothetical protein E1211_17930 [Micromonospora sp. 15K316]|uniref:hypothetical protein n=1 Tax=Micromonospora sp. 15K316 TaxID=2530376 RepID=UPI00104B3516|nr:hypothetical protein [Micromonospora sp. 15K316]TDC34226.1 hypothetical protein E1211_17930 [Micromonospora sp. 15K316]
MRVLDNAFHLYSQGYELARIVKLDTGHKVRVRIRRDSYERQSYAVAEVLNDNLTWTGLVSDPAELWHPGSPYLASHFGADHPARNGKPEALLNEIADRLLTRAAAVLAA